MVQLNYHPYEEACTGLRSIIEKSRADSAVHAWFLNELEHYLYDPNSPYRNDEYYIAVLEAITTGKTEKRTDQTRALFRLEMLRKNRLGTLAQNIHFQLDTGKSSALYDIDSEYTLIVFYDPECETCHEILKEMASSKFIKEHVSGGKTQKASLKVLTICTNGTKKSWKKVIPMLPPNWTNGYDVGESVIKKKLYDLRAFPSLYLLGKDKMVILKDAPLTTVINYLYNNIL